MTSSFESSPRISQKELARVLGLSQSTVSLGLRNHPDIGPATCARIREAARRLGYVPDPCLSALSAYRKRVKPVRYQGTLAWLSNDAIGEGRGEGRGWPALPACHGSAAERAGQLGYRLEDFCLREPGMSARRMEEIFCSRGIPGILVSPSGGNGSVEGFCFGRFSAVTFDHSLESPRLHCVSYHRLGMMERVFRRLHELGYRRPGLAVYPESDRRAGRAWSAGFRNEQHRYADVVHVPPLLAESGSRELFFAWFRQWEPDVILTPEASRLDWLEEAGVAVPGDTGFCLLSVPPPGKEHCAGCQEDPARVGAGAVELLVDMIGRHEVGIPASQVCVLTEGVWRQGSTLGKRIRPAAVAAAAATAATPSLSTGGDRWRRESM
ncbi:MAG: LacI family DNA-binding transcriptional regulator [Opitutaceae bacterium]|jgi:DNA-binding LacI/PurR family transcriptional regulator|nr:LacI family DNA-binding transcriptional regulator [Opitutaceae bacterium]